MEVQLLSLWILRISFLIWAACAYSLQRKLNSEAEYLNLLKETPTFIQTDEWREKVYWPQRKKVARLRNWRDFYAAMAALFLLLSFWLG